MQLVQDLYEGSETVVRCAVGTTESFKVEVGLHQGSALSPFLFAVIMDRLMDEVRREPPFRRDQERSGEEIRILEVCIGKKRDENE